MIEQRLLTPGESEKYRKDVILNTVDEAFDVCCSGIGNQAQTVDNVVTDHAAGLATIRWPHVFTPSTHFFRHAHFGLWSSLDSSEQYRSSHKEDIPLANSPLADRHIRLIQQMRVKYYEEVTRTCLRMTLGGEEWARSRRLGEVITTEEFQHLLIAGKARELIGFQGEIPPISKVRDNISFGFDLQNAGGTVFFDQLSAASRDAEQSLLVRVPVIQAAIYKLGGMMGYLEQLAFEADFMGLPLEADYEPPEKRIPRVVCSKEDWQKILNQPRPGLGELYSQGHRVLVSAVERMGMIDDRFVSYLLPFHQLPHLA